MEVKPFLARFCAAGEGYYALVKVGTDKPDCNRQTAKREGLSAARPGLIQSRVGRFKPLQQVHNPQGANESTYVDWLVLKRTGEGRFRALVAAISIARHSRRFGTALAPRLTGCSFP